LGRADTEERESERRRREVVANLMIFGGRGEEIKAQMRNKTAKWTWSRVTAMYIVSRG